MVSGRVNRIQGCKTHSMPRASMEMGARGEVCLWMCVRVDKKSAREREGEVEGERERENKWLGEERQYGWDLLLEAKSNPACTHKQTQNLGKGEAGAQERIFH